MSDTKTTPPTTATTDRYGYRDALAEVSVDLAGRADRAAAAARSVRWRDTQRSLLLDHRGLALIQPMAHVNKRPGCVVRAQRAMGRAPDTRAIKREIQAGNPYMVALLRARGVAYVRGSGLVRMHQK